MTISFETEDDVIIFGFEKIISYARNKEQIFVAQCVWWLALVSGFELGLISYIDTLRKREMCLLEDDSKASLGKDTVS